MKDSWTGEGRTLEKVGGNENYHKTETESETEIHHRDYPRHGLVVYGRPTTIVRCTLLFKANRCFM